MCLRVRLAYNSAEIEPIWMESGAHSVGWPWQNVGSIRAVAIAGEPGEIFFSYTLDFSDFPSAIVHEIWTQ